MSKNPPELPESPPPFSLEEAEKWIGWVEDVATTERDLGFATRFVLGNLLLRLTRTGVLDGHGFIKSLREALPNLEEENERMATRVLLDSLLTQLPVPESDGGMKH